MKIQCILVDKHGKPGNRIGGRIPYHSNYGESRIPIKYIKHGCMDINTKMPMYIVDKYDKYYIVAYTADIGGIVQLGYLPENVKILDEEYLKTERINKLNNKLKTFKI